MPLLKKIQCFSPNLSPPLKKNKIKNTMRDSNIVYFDLNVSVELLFNNT